MQLIEKMFVANLLFGGVLRITKMPKINGALDHREQEIWVAKL